ncbi:hypothetical protein STEG23_017942 [Scotinomys teguina]
MSPTDFRATWLTHWKSALPLTQELLLGINGRNKGRSQPGDCSDVARRKGKFSYSFLVIRVPLLAPDRGASVTNRVKSFDLQTVVSCYVGAGI